MKKSVLLGLTVLAAVSLVGCKSKESAYKKAYEKAKAQETSYTTTPVTQSVYENTQTVVTPSTTTTPATNEYDNTYSNTNTNYNNNSNYTSTDNYSTANIKRYSVVIGSYGSLSGAEAQRNAAINRGYGSAKIITGGLGYRVVATTFDDLQSAKNSRNALIRIFDGAWIYDKYK